MSPRDGMRPLHWFLIAAAALTGGLLSFSILATTSLVEQDAERLLPLLIVELDGALMLLVLLPAIIAFIRRYPVRRQGWFRRLAAHLAFSIAIGATHTLLMWGSRTLLWRWLDWGVYGYDLTPTRFLMEYSKQSLVYASVHILVSLIAHQRRRREAEIRTARLEQQLGEARLATLRGQLAPHFLFNTLNMIAAHVHDEPDVAETMIERLGDLLRMTLQDTGRAEVPLARELRYLEAYLAIMRQRFGDRVAVTIDCPQDTGSAAVPNLVLQPLVENAVKYGTSHRTPSSINVHARLCGDRLRLEVVDAGGAGRDAGGTGTGIGLENLRMRLAELHGDEAYLISEATRDGWRVVLDLPWRETTEED